jgi:hypothetical protein
MGWNFSYIELFMAAQVSKITLRRFEELADLVSIILLSFS